MKKLLSFALVLHLAAPAKAQTIVNGDMETWTHYSSASVPLMKPTGWNNWDDGFITGLSFTAPGKPFTSMLYKDSVNVHSGTAAAKIITALQGDSNIYSGAMSYGLLSQVYSGTYKGTQALGGVNVTSRISKVSAWLSSHPMDISDAAVMQVFAVKNDAGFAGYDSVVGTGYLPVYSDVPYTLTDCNIVYKDPDVVPDRILVQFNISVLSGKPGGVFYIDDVSMTDPTGIETPLFTGESFNVFPNPARDVLYISNTAGATEIKIFTTTGRLVRQQAINGNTSIDISTLPAGSYLYQATDARCTKPYSGTFIRE